MRSAPCFGVSEHEGREKTGVCARFFGRLTPSQSDERGYDQPSFFKIGLLFFDTPRLNLDAFRSQIHHDVSVYNQIQNAMHVSNIPRRHPYVRIFRIPDKTKTLGRHTPHSACRLEPPPPCLHILRICSPMPRGRRSRADDVAAPRTPHSARTSHEFRWIITHTESQAPLPRPLQ